MEETDPSIEDYIDIIRRRKMWFIFTVPFLLFLTVAVTMALPPIFQSQGVILIQNQEIPEELVKSTVEGLAEQQIEVTKQKIMTAAKIQEIIDKHGLYPELRDKSATHELTEKFRNSMGVEMIEREVQGEWGQISRESVAFIVSFMDKDPEKAHMVTRELTTLFLEENVKARTGKADETAQFLKEEADRMQVRVEEIENKITAFKVQYGDSLPELLQYNLSAIERIEAQIVSTQDEATGISDQIHSLNMDLSNVSPYIQYTSDNSGASITPRQRLMELKDEYSRAIVKYSDSHPDIKRLKEEIAVAENEIEKTKNTVSDDEVLNPQYRQIQSQIGTLEKEVKRLQERRKKLEADLKDYNNRVVRSHQVKRAYDDMTRDYESKLEKYQELRAKQLEANVAQSMEAENKAGSFSLAEPPSMPESPVKPARKKLLLIGFVLSIGIGIGLMIALEFLDPGVRGVGNNTRVLGQQPLAVIGHIYTADDYQVISYNLKKLVVIALVFCVLAIAVFHFFVMSFDVLLMKILSKIGVF